MFTGPEAYDRFMGRYSVPLAPLLTDFAEITRGRVLDVGCGPGALTAELVDRVGAASVSAIDPSMPFVDAARRRHPGVDVRHGTAEELPFPDGEFDGTLAQLVVHFMASPVDGLREMARVTRNGGVVAACVWDHAEGGSPLVPFWRAARELEPDVEDESSRAGVRPGELGQLFRAAGLDAVEETALTVHVEHPSFDDWWDPFTLGVGPAGAYLASLDGGRREWLRERCTAEFPSGGFTMDARAWAARGRA